MLPRVTGISKKIWNLADFHLSSHFKLIRLFLDDQPASTGPSFGRVLEVRVRISFVNPPRAGFA
jgi:hypothetical protein